MSEINPVLDHVDAGLETALSELLDLISIPSVSGQIADGTGVRAAADWLAQALGAMDMDARVVPTEGHPVVLARSSGHGTGPRLLFYGHYDVQPAEPLEDWHTPPFEGQVRDVDGRRVILGRGASDSKSQLWSFIVALRAWRAVHGAFPAEIIVMLEGEEETGSASLAGFIDRHRDELACDAAFICDSDMWSPTQPAITTRLKGLLHERVVITAPNGDLHSGHFGTVAANPIRILSGILAAIHDADGRIAIDGFYDGADEVSPALRAKWKGLSTAEPLAGIDLAGGTPEPGYSALELMWARPAIDFCGITGGNQGPGERSVLPGSATARFSFRLVGRQDPERVRGLFRDFVRARVPAGCRVEFVGSGSSSAITTREDSPYVAATARGLEAEWGEPTVMKGTGGTVPVVNMISDGLGADCVVVGFILPGDAIHAPNENYDTDRLHKGIRSWVRVFHEVRKLNP